MSNPSISNAEIEAVERVLRSGQLSNGPQLEAFEKELGQYLGCQDTMGVSSGTSALHLCVKAAGFAEGDEVITTPFSFVASANCILYERAKPVFVDIDLESLNIDLGMVEGAITSKTRGILIVHVFGKPVDMATVQTIAQKYSLWVIEDACEAIGAEYNGQKVGTFGDAAAFGFYPNKQMTLAEGGAVTTSHSDWAQLIRSLRNQGRADSSQWLTHHYLGYNYRLDELRAALGLVQVRRLSDLLSKRAQVAQFYTERLKSIEQIVLPTVESSMMRISWFAYVIRLRSTISRTVVMAALEKAGVPSRAYFPPIHLQPFYQNQFGYRRGDFPASEAAGDSCLALPFSSEMSEDQVDFVCRNLQQALSLTRLK